MKLNPQYPLSEAEEVLNQLKSAATVINQVLVSRDALDPDGALPEDLTEAVSYLTIRMLGDISDLEGIVDFTRTHTIPRCEIVEIERIKFEKAYPQKTPTMQAEETAQASAGLKVA